jgi:homotetrameric cytidine deaminase
MIDNCTAKNLLKKAFDAMKKSYAPYSDYNVGAALLTSTDEIYLGCNVENSSFSLTCCAERTAFLKAVSDGHKSFKAIAIIGGKKAVDCDSIETFASLDFAFPCGACRQVMQEFCTENFPIVLTNGKEIKILTLSEALPFAFSKSQL